MTKKTLHFGLNQKFFLAEAKKYKPKVQRTRFCRLKTECLTYSFNQKRITKRHKKEFELNNKLKNPINKLFTLNVLNERTNLFVSEKNLNTNFFFNCTFDKGRLKNLILWFLKNYGQKKTIDLLEELKSLGYGYATKAGISLGIEDLKIPPQKIPLLIQAEKQIKIGQNRYKKGEISAVERVQRLIDTWHQTSENLKQEVIKHFEATDVLNPVYMMAFSGARGNISQVRQLVGMRGLMSDPQGQIIDFPIRSNFREGLTLTEYIISTYGARKGIVDTALRTANAGYLTRRLVDVAQHVIITKLDCGTERGILVFDMKEGFKTIYSLQNRLIGRVLAKDIISNNKIIAFRNQEISSNLAEAIIKITKKAYIRSPLTCEAKKLVCQLCYGWSLANHRLVSIGEAVGIIAAQSIGEPGTQLTMRTFHTGGVFSGGMSEQIIAQHDGYIEYNDLIPGICVRTPQGEIAFLTKGEGQLIFHKCIDDSFKSNVDLKKDQTQIFKIPPYSLLFMRHLQTVKKKEIIAQLSSFSTKNVQKGDAEQTLCSELEGELYLSDVNLLEKFSEYNDLSIQALGRGYAWILSGKIYQIPFYTTMFAQPTDLINKNTLLNQINWISPNQCLLTNNIFYSSFSNLKNINKLKKIETINFVSILSNRIYKQNPYSLQNTLKSLIRPLVYTKGRNGAKKLNQEWKQNIYNTSLKTNPFIFNHSLKSQSNKLKYLKNKLKSLKFVKINSIRIIEQQFQYNKKFKKNKTYFFYQLKNLSLPLLKDSTKEAFIPRHFNLNQKIKFQKFEQKLLNLDKRKFNINQKIIYSNFKNYPFQKYTRKYLLQLFNKKKLDITKNVKEFNFLNPQKRHKIKKLTTFQNNLHFNKWTIFNLIQNSIENQTISNLINNDEIQKVQNINQDSDLLIFDKKMSSPKDKNVKKYKNLNNSFSILNQLSKKDFLLENATVNQNLLYENQKSILKISNLAVSQKVKSIFTNNLLLKQSVLLIDTLININYKKTVYRLSCNSRLSRKQELNREDYQFFTILGINNKTQKNKNNLNLFEQKFQTRFLAPFYEDYIQKIKSISTYYFQPRLEEKSNFLEKINNSSERVSLNSREMNLNPLFHKKQLNDFTKYFSFYENTYNWKPKFNYILQWNPFLYSKNSSLIKKEEYLNNSGIFYFKNPFVYLSSTSHKAFTQLSLPYGSYNLRSFYPSSQSDSQSFYPFFASEIKPKGKWKPSKSKLINIPTELKTELCSYNQFTLKRNIKDLWIKKGFYFLVNKRKIFFKFRGQQEKFKCFTLFNVQSNYKILEMSKNFYYLTNLYKVNLFSFKLNSTKVKIRNPNWKPWFISYSSINNLISSSNYRLSKTSNKIKINHLKEPRQQMHNKWTEQNNDNLIFSNRQKNQKKLGLFENKKNLMSSSFDYLYNSNKKFSVNMNEIYWIPQENYEIFQNSFDQKRVKQNEGYKLKNNLFLFNLINRQRNIKEVSSTLKGVLKIKKQNLKNKDLKLETKNIMNSALYLNTIKFKILKYLLKKYVVKNSSKTVLYSFLKRDIEKPGGFRNQKLFFNTFSFLNTINSNSTFKDQLNKQKINPLNLTEISSKSVNLNKLFSFSDQIDEQKINITLYQGWVVILHKKDNFLNTSYHDFIYEAGKQVLNDIVFDTQSVYITNIVLQSNKEQKIKNEKFKQINSKFNFEKKKKFIFTLNFISLTKTCNHNKKVFKLNQWISSSIESPFLNFKYKLLREKNLKTKLLQSELNILNSKTNNFQFSFFSMKTNNDFKNKIVYLIQPMKYTLLPHIQKYKKEIYQLHNKIEEIPFSLLLLNQYYSSFLNKQKKDLKLLSSQTNFSLIFSTKSKWPILPKAILKQQKSKIEANRKNFRIKSNNSFFSYYPFPFIQLKLMYKNIQDSIFKIPNLNLNMFPNINLHAYQFYQSKNYPKFLHFLLTKSINSNFSSSLFNKTKNTDLLRTSFIQKNMKQNYINSLYYLKFFSFSICFDFSLNAKLNPFTNQRVGLQSSLIEENTLKNLNSSFGITNKLNKKIKTKVRVKKDRIQIKKLNLISKNESFSSTGFYSPFEGEILLNQLYRNRYLKPNVFLTENSKQNQNIISKSFISQFNKIKNEVKDANIKLINKFTTNSVQAIQKSSKILNKKDPFVINEKINDLDMKIDLSQKEVLFLTKSDIFSLKLSNQISPFLGLTNSTPSVKLVNQKWKLGDQIKKNIQNEFLMTLVAKYSNFLNIENAILLELQKLNDKRISTIPSNRNQITYQNVKYQIKALRVGPINFYPKLRLESFLLKDDPISTDLVTNKSGQIIHLSSSKITFRIAQPISISNRGILYYQNGDFITKNSPVVTLPFQTLKTGDIVQGIPKVEQILEARTTRGGRLFIQSLAVLLQCLFERYNQIYPLDLAVRKSLLKIQQLIVDAIQRVYRSQGVGIADKHVEIIVRQMTMKVQIIHPGYTGFFPGELIQLETIEYLNTLLLTKVKYAPVVLGISKASLEVDSFLSAASFQYTTKVLTKAALFRKRDFLKGLKENLLVGNLLPAGTGYFVYLQDQQK